MRAWGRTRRRAPRFSRPSARATTPRPVRLAWTPRRRRPRSPGSARAPRPATRHAARSSPTPPRARARSSSSGGSSGSVQPGGSCKFDSDCAPAAGGGASCLGGGFAADGGFGGEQCIQTTTGTSGQGPCIGTINGSATETSWSGTSAPPAHAYVCNVASGLTCNSTTQQCSPQVGTGQPCSQDNDCVAADYCDFSGSSGSTCAPRLADGSSCAMSFSACMTTSYCNSTTQTCQPALPNGAACGSGNSTPCQSGICVNNKCGASSSAGLALFCN